MEGIPLMTCMASEDTTMQYMVLNPKPMPMASTATIMSIALITIYEYWAGITPRVAYWIIVQRPIMPPADIPLGIMKHSHAKAKKKHAAVSRM